MPSDIPRLRHRSAETAIQGATIEYIRGSDPDLIMVYHSGTMPSIQCEAASDFCRVSEEEFIEAFEAGSASRALSLDNRVRRAPAVAAQFLIEELDFFAVYAVNYGGRYNHIYAVRHGGRLLSAEYCEVQRARPIDVIPASE